MHRSHGLQHLRHKRLTFASADKSGYTLGFAQRIAHTGLHAETGGVLGGGGITTLDTSCTFTNIPGPGIRTAYFAAFGSWPGVLPKNAESLRDSDAHDARRCSAGVAAPLGCVIFLQFGDVAVFFTLCAVLSECARWGWYHYPRCALRAAETLDGRLSKGLICRFLRLPSSTPCAVTFSANMQISLSAISVANTFALWYDKSQIRIFRR